jgi:hypothetical protein
MSEYPPVCCIKLMLGIDQTRDCRIRESCLLDQAFEARQKKIEKQTTKEGEKKPRHPGFPRGPPPWY